jgi:hypothetical protein
MIGLITIKLTTVSLVMIMLLAIIYLVTNNLFVSYGSLNHN